MKYCILAFTLILLSYYGSAQLYKNLWPQQIENKTYFQVMATQIIHITMYALVNGWYFLIYSLNHPFFEQYKVEKLPWPWESNLKEWQILRNKTIKNFFMTLFLGLILSIINSYFASQKSNLRMDGESIPNFIEMSWQLAFCWLIEDLFFYTTHRSLHHPSLYKFHKQHHTYNVTVSISAEYAHPLEYFAGNLLPFIAGPRLLGQNMHLITFFIWIQLRVYKTLSAHSGYVFPWEVFQYLPYFTSAEYHSYHHSHNNGNYGSMMTIWDGILGTSKQYYIDKVEEHFGIQEKQGKED